VWRALVRNVKTGPVVACDVGHTLAETWASCAGCPMRPDAWPRARGGSRPEVLCYAWRGRAAVGLLASQKRLEAHPHEYTLERALTDRLLRTRAVRLGTIGDPSAADPFEALASIDACRAEGLSVLSYTHFWRDRGAWLRGEALASCQSLSEADEAIDAGWRASVVLPPGVRKTMRTPKGRLVLLCPHYTAKDAGRLVQCNDCRLCDARHSCGDRIPAIGFPAKNDNRQARRLPMVKGD
jgi:hypothetical protein